jgi:hypothetical protein
MTYILKQLYTGCNGLTDKIQDIMLEIIHIYNIILKFQIIIALLRFK